MAYQKTKWVNGQPPAINADNLNKIEDELEALDKKPVLLAANEDVMTTTSSAWTGLKGFTLLNGADPMKQLQVRTIVQVSPSGASGDLRVVVFDYSGDNALLTGSAKSVASTDPILVELDPLDLSSLSPSNGYTVSLQAGNVTGGSISIVATEFYGS